MIGNKDWNNVSLGELVRAVSCDIPNEDQTVWNLSLEDIEPQTGRILKQHFCKVRELGSSKCCFDQRHVLYSKLRPYLNKVVLPDSCGVGTSELIPMLPDTSRILREYLALYLRSPAFVKYASENSRGANLPRISMRALWSHPVPFPQDLSEQNRIVERVHACMDRIDESLAIVRRSAEQIEELKRVLVLGHDTSDRNWRLVGDVVEWIPSSEPVQKDVEYHFAGIKSFGRGLFEREVRTSNDFAYTSLRRLREGDFIYPKLMAWEGAFAMVTSQFDSYVVSPEFVVFRTKSHEVCCEVLDAYFRSPVCLDVVQGASTGSNRRRRRLNPAAFLKLRVPVPDASTQHKLQAVYQYELKTRQEMSRREEKLNVLRDCILRRAFTGEL